MTSSRISHGKRDGEKKNTGTHAQTHTHAQPNDSVSFRLSSGRPRTSSFFFSNKLSESSAVDSMKDRPFKIRSERSNTIFIYLFIYVFVSLREVSFFSVAILRNTRKLRTATLWSFLLSFSLSFFQACMDYYHFLFFHFIFHSPTTLRTLCRACALMRRVTQTLLGFRITSALSVMESFSRLQQVVRS